MLAGALALILAIATVAFASGDSGTVVAMLCLLPAALLAMEFGVAGGVLGALAGSALVVAWVTLRDIPLETGEVVVRCTLLTLLGTAFGLLGDRLRHAVADRVLIRDMTTVAESRHESSRMWEVSFEMLATAGFDGRFHQLNPRWQEILGWSEHELTSRPFVEFVHPDDRERTEEEAAKLMAGGDRAVSFENRYRCKDGSYRWLLWNSKASTDDDLIYTAATDITDRKLQEVAMEASEARLRWFSRELEARVERRTRELAAANKELEAFSYSVSHDLRSPLRAIDGYSQAILEDCGDDLPESARADLARVRAASQRMSTLIDEILGLALITRRELRDEPVDLSAVAGEVAVELRRQEAGRDVELHIEPGLHVTGDPELLRMVMLNLLENAWKFTARSRHARVELVLSGAENGRSTFAVRDNGAGFDMRYAEKLFLPFERLHSQQDYSGTGVGLTIVARILDRHGGRVWAEGTPGSGAAFFFDLSTGLEHHA